MSNRHDIGWRQANQPPRTRLRDLMILVIVLAAWVAAAYIDQRPGSINERTTQCTSSE